MNHLGGANGVIQIDGDKWKQQRRFVLRVLRDFGVGRMLIEQQIMKEVEIFIDYLEVECNGQEMDVCAMHAVCVGNIITNILFGYRFPQVIKRCNKSRPCRFPQISDLRTSH